MARRRLRGATKKLFHKIGEVCQLTDTEPYVLRYWESEFPFLAPEKNSAGQRIYTDDDIEMVRAIKRLLYEEGYTTAGARRQLEKEIAERTAAAAPEADDEVAAPAAAAPVGGADPALHGALVEIRDGLQDLRSMLAGELGRSEGPVETGSRPPSRQSAGGSRPASTPPRKAARSGKPASKSAAPKKKAVSKKASTGRKAASKKKPARGSKRSR